ncbi:hypothetical protein Ciccas_014249, partial [Cichlidogyrus casuarinus]
MISIFTATITTALSAGSFSSPMQHRVNSITKVDVLNGSFEEVLAYQYGFRPKRIESVPKLIEEKQADADHKPVFDSDSSEAIMMENHMFIHLRNAHEHEISRLARGDPRFTSHQSDRGLLLNGFKRSAIHCMQSYTRQHQFEIYHTMASMRHSNTS